MIFLISLFLWTVVVISSLVLFPAALCIWLATVWLDKRLVFLHYFTCFWGSLYIWLNPFWRVKIIGRNKIKRGHTYVIVANHQSLTDILSIFRLFIFFKWVSKDSLFNIPLIGWNMSLNRYIKIDRHRLSGQKMMLKECEKNLSWGNSIFIFPEGTRSNDGRLGMFKSGAFELALKTKTDIVPVVIEGSARALPKHGYKFHGRHTIKVKVQDPLCYEDFKSLSAKSLAQKVKDLIAANLN